MSDIDLKELRERFLKGGSTAEILEAAATVANAIHIGAGAMIVGSLMEADLRKALHLKPGELVTVGRHSNGESPK